MIYRGRKGSITEHFDGFPWHQAELRPHGTIGPIDAHGATFDQSEFNDIERSVLSKAVAGYDTGPLVCRWKQYMIDKIRRARNGGSRA